MFITRDGNKSIRLPCVIRVTRDFNSANATDVALLQIFFLLTDADGTPHSFAIDFEPEEMIKFAEFYRDSLHSLVEAQKEELKVKKEEMISYEWG